MAFEYLLQQYPHHVAVSSLPLDGDESKVCHQQCNERLLLSFNYFFPMCKVEFATLLFQHGMLVMDQQLDEEFV